MASSAPAAARLLEFRRERRRALGLGLEPSRAASPFRARRAWNTACASDRTDADHDQAAESRSAGRRPAGRRQAVLARGPSARRGSGGPGSGAGCTCPAPSSLDAVADVGRPPPAGARERQVEARPPAHALSISMRPPCSCTMRATIDRPRPVPLPYSLVVKKGRKMLASRSPPESPRRCRRTPPAVSPGPPSAIDRRCARRRRHRVQGVGQQVEEDLFELVAVAVDPGLRARLDHRPRRRPPSGSSPSGTWCRGRPRPDPAARARCPWGARNSAVP